MGFRHAHRFPERPTRVHHEALERILALQVAGGGFQSAFTTAPNPEETGLAMIAMRAALDALAPGALRDRTEGAYAAALAFQRLALTGALPRLALWTGKVMVDIPHLSEAIVLASLAGAGQVASLTPREAAPLPGR
jgi:hypothetical protein